MEQENVMRLNDAKRKSFENGWKSAVKATVEYIKRNDDCGYIDCSTDYFIEQYLKEIEL